MPDSDSLLKLKRIHIKYRYKYIYIYTFHTFFQEQQYSSQIVDINYIIVSLLKVMKCRNQKKETKLTH